MTQPAPEAPPVDSQPSADAPDADEHCFIDRRSRLDRALDSLDLVLGVLQNEDLSKLGEDEKKDLRRETVRAYNTFRFTRTRKRRRKTWPKEFSVGSLQRPAE